MQRLIKEVNTLVSDEYALNSQKLGPVSHSDYESVAILREEVEELRDSFADIVNECERFWKFVKTNAPSVEKKQSLKRIRQDGILTACEAIQVAAMAYKAIQTIDSRGEQ